MSQCVPRERERERYKKKDVVCLKGLLSGAARGVARAD